MTRKCVPQGLLPGNGDESGVTLDPVLADLLLDPDDSAFQIHLEPSVFTSWAGASSEFFIAHSLLAISIHPLSSA